MKKIYLFLFILFIPFFLFARFKTGGTDQVIIKLKKDDGESGVLLKLNKASLRIGKRIEFKRKFDGDKYIIKLDGKKNDEEIRNIIDELKKDIDIEYTEPDRIAYPLIEPNDPYYLWQWHYKSASTEIGAINLPLAWDITTGSSSTIIAILDTGIISHEDISSSRIVAGYDIRYFCCKRW